MWVDDQRGGIGASRRMIMVAEDGKFRLILRRISNAPRQHLQAILLQGCGVANGGGIPPPLAHNRFHRSRGTRGFNQRRTRICTSNIVRALTESLIFGQDTPDLLWFPQGSEGVIYWQHQHIANGYLAS